jgi:hypothetical protein
MVRTGNGPVRAAILVIVSGLLTATGGTTALSSDVNCRRLEGLARQYAGVVLTSQQQQLKRRLVAWYNSNCKRARSAQASR